MVWRNVVSVVIHQIPDTVMPKKLKTHVGNMVFGSVEVGALTNVCKKQKLDEPFLHQNTKSWQIQLYPASASPKVQENAHYHGTMHQARKWRGSQNPAHSQVRRFVFSHSRQTRHPIWTIFEPVYSGWTLGTRHDKNYSQIQCWWGATPSSSLPKPSMAIGTKSGPWKWVAHDLMD